MKVLIMGLGKYKNGSGISAARFFIERGCDVLITDCKEKSFFKEQIKEINSFARMLRLAAPKYVFGEHKKSDFAWADLIVRNPGVKKHSEFLAYASSLDKKIETDISIFLNKARQCKIIGITGTRGKSTTASLIYEIFKKKYPRVWLGGNIQISPLSFIDKIKTNDIIVLELSSWMLENFAQKNLAPNIAVVTNIYQDHLNAYKNFAEYLKAKKNIFTKQSPRDFLILNNDNKYSKKFKSNGKTYYFSKKKLKDKNGVYIEGEFIFVRENNKSIKIANLKDIALKGEHNLENVLASLTVAKILKAPDASIRNVLRDFRGLPHRQEILGKKKGILFINDTTATSPDGAIAALKNFATNEAEKNIVLLAGGADKDLEYRELSCYIKKYCKAVILFKGAATEKIKKELRMLKVRFKEVDSMKEAVLSALAVAISADIILLSPGAASFGIFENEFHRGEEFRKIVKKI